VSTRFNFVSESVFCVEMRKRGDLSLAEKSDVLKEYDDLRQMSRRQASCESKVSQSLLGRMLKSRQKISEMRQWQMRVRIVNEKGPLLHL